MDFWTELDAIRERWNVLDHPFYQRWSEGTLREDELAHYAGEYRHAVVALASASDAVARQTGDAGFAAHAAEEASHVELWDRFAAAVGGDTGRAPAPETAECAAAWAGEETTPVAARLAALYAIEAAQPAISETKREGLVARYGFAPSSDATAYFDLHATLDVHHAEHDRRALAAVLEDADAGAALAAAESALRRNWALLDGVDRNTALRRP